MITSFQYYRDSKLNEYSKRLNDIEMKMKSFSDYNKFNNINFNLCRFPNYPDDIKLKSLKLLKMDYFSNKCSYVNNKTLFDICIRNNRNFNLIFNSIGSKNIIETLYTFIDKLPCQIRLIAPFKNFNDETDCYIRMYINMYLCYDLLTSLLENYSVTTEVDTLNFLEILINELFYPLDNVFS